MLCWPEVTAGQGGPGDRECVGLVGKRKVWVRFNIYSEAVLEWEGRRSSHLLLRLVEKVLCLVLPDLPCLSRLMQIRLRAVISTALPKTTAGKWHLSHTSECACGVRAVLAVGCHCRALPVASQGPQQDTWLGIFHCITAQSKPVCLAPSTVDAPGLPHGPGHKQLMFCQHPQELVLIPDSCA